MKKTILILLLLFIPAIYADQSELRATKKIGIYSGGVIGSGSYLLDTSFIYNFNEYITIGIGGASGRTKDKDNYPFYPLRIQESYDYAETIGYFSFNLFPIKSFPFYFSGYAGKDSGRKGEFLFQTLTVDGFIAQLFELHVKPKPIYGGGGGIRYYNENGLFWGCEFGALYRDYSIDSFQTKYEVNTYGRFPGYNPSIIDSYISTKFREEEYKGIFQRQSEFTPYGKFYIGISI